VGLPVVSTRMGGIPELLEDGVSGIMVPQRDPESLAEALGRLARDPALAARLRAAGLARVADIWDRNKNLVELAQVFDERIEPVATSATTRREGPASADTARSAA
jgi:colanic acid/amylovoran biosynthesis glycosyltransferase